MPSTLLNGLGTLFSMPFINTKVNDWYERETYYQQVKKKLSLMNWSVSMCSFAEIAIPDYKSG